MDSLTQAALGAAVGVATMGRRTAPWKAAAWGAAWGTLPDLDAFIDHGDPVSNMTLHRGHSHALFWLTLAAPLLGALAARLNGEWAQRRRWWLAAWLALVTHPLLDWMTVYGTQLLRPFTDTPYAIGSIFIIDPLYTLPLLVGVGGALAVRSPARWRWNAAGLLLSCLYLGWTVTAQAHVRALAQASLARQGIVPTQLLVTPAPLNTLLWRVVAMTPDGYHEGFRSVLDRGHDITFERFDSGAALAPALAGLPAVERMRWFTRGFYKLSEVDGQARITDLRMGQEPYYTFSFGVARRSSGGGGWVAQPVTSAEGGRPENLGPQFDWLGQRMLGRDAPPPR
jgi:inner membrane protein